MHPICESGVPIQAGLHVYAHCLRGTPGGVALLVINTERAATRTLGLPVRSERYTMAASGDSLQTRNIELNGARLNIGANDALPPLTGAATSAGSVAFAPATITFLALPQATNRACT